MKNIKKVLGIILMMLLMCEVIGCHQKKQDSAVGVDSALQADNSIGSDVINAASISANSGVELLEGESRVDLAISSDETDNKIIGDTIMFSENFDSQDKQFIPSTENSDITNQWIAFYGNDSSAIFELAKGEGFGNSDCIKYVKTGTGNANIHLDINLEVSKNTEYIFTAKVKGDGNIIPIIAVQNLKWNFLSQTPAEKNGEWQEISCSFNSGNNEVIRFKWYPSTQGKAKDGLAGVSWIDDIKVEQKGKQGIRASIDEKSGIKINPKLFGINMLFFVEQDFIRSNETYQTSVTHLAPKVVRYPGGTCADNYLWKEKNIYTLDWYPNKADPEGDMDTEEFIEFANKNGAEPIMVLNYRSYIKMGDIEACYKDAEDWVRFVNIEKKAGIKYWELGNELNFKENTEVRCQVTPEQYAQNYLELRKRLRAIDPNIQLGIVLSNQWEDTRKNVVEQWNRRVMETIKCDADFIIIHFYPGINKEQFIQNGMSIRDKIMEIRAGIAKLGGNPDIPVFVTEWNVPSQSNHIKAQSIGHVTGIAQGFLEMIDSNVDYATIWPMQNAGTSMIKQKDYSLQPAGVMFHWLNNELAGCELVKLQLESTSPITELKAFASQDGKELRIIAINRSADMEESVVINCNDYTAKDDGILKTMMSESALANGEIDINNKNIIVNQQKLRITDKIAFKILPMSVSILKVPIN